MQIDKISPSSRVAEQIFAELAESYPVLFPSTSQAPSFDFLLLCMSDLVNEYPGRAHGLAYSTVRSGFSKERISLRRSLLHRRTLKTAEYDNQDFRRKLPLKHHIEAQSARPPSSLLCRGIASLRRECFPANLWRKPAMALTAM